MWTLSGKSSATLFRRIRLIIKTTIAINVMITMHHIAERCRRLWSSSPASGIFSLSSSLISFLVRSFVRSGFITQCRYYLRSNRAHSSLGSIICTVGSDCEFPSISTLSDYLVVCGIRWAYHKRFKYSYSISSFVKWIILIHATISAHEITRLQ